MKPSCAVLQSFKRNLIFPIMGAGKGHWIGKWETLKKCFGNWHFEALCTCPFDLQRSIASIYSLLIIIFITNHPGLELTRLCRNMVVIEKKIFLHPWVLDDGARFRRFKTRRPRDYVVRRWGRGSGHYMPPGILTWNFLHFGQVGPVARRIIQEWAFLKEIWFYEKKRVLRRESFRR